MKKVPALIAAVITCAIFSLVACKKDSPGTKPTNVSQNIHAVAKTGYSSTVIADAVCYAYSARRNCWRGYGNCAWAVTGDDYQQLENQMPVLLMLSDDKAHLLVRYQRALADLDDPQLNLQDGVDIPDAICQILGVSSIHIEPGEYGPDYNENGYGDYELNVSVQ